jgi:hypothetical protein
MREDLYKKWEKLRKNENTAYLAELYYAPEKYYPGLPYEEYEVIKEIILDELKKRKWHFCPYHGVPLLFRTVIGYVYFECPVGKERYIPKDSRVEPLTIDRRVKSRTTAIRKTTETIQLRAHTVRWEPSEYLRKERIKKEYAWARTPRSPQYIKSVIEDLNKFRFWYPHVIPEVPPDIDVESLKRLLHKLAYDERLPQYLRKRFLQDYWML